MPFQSQAQWRWAFATKANYDARAGQAIAGNLGRNEAGQFARIDEAVARSASLHGGKKPKKTARSAAQVAAAKRETAHAALQAAKIDKAVYDGVTALDDAPVKAGEESDAVKELVKAGYAEEAGGMIVPSALGSRLAKAAESGKPGKVAQVVARESQRTQQRTERTRARAQALDDKIAAAEDYVKSARNDRQRAIAQRRLDAAKTQRAALGDVGKSTLKHMPGKHNQSSHGHRGAVGGAFRSAYTAARAGGKTHSEAWNAGKHAAEGVREQMRVEKRAQAAANPKPKRTTQPEAAAPAEASTPFVNSRGQKLMTIATVGRETIRQAAATKEGVLDNLQFDLEIAQGALKQEQELTAKVEAAGRKRDPQYAKNHQDKIDEIKQKMADAQEDLQHYRRELGITEQFTPLSYRPNPAAVELDREIAQQRQLEAARTTQPEVATRKAPIEQVNELRASIERNQQILDTIPLNERGSSYAQLISKRIQDDETSLRSIDSDARKRGVAENDFAYHEQRRAQIQQDLQRTQARLDSTQQDLRSINEQINRLDPRAGGKYNTFVDEQRRALVERRTELQARERQLSADIDSMRTQQDRINKESRPAVLNSQEHINLRTEANMARARLEYGKERNSEGKMRALTPERRAALQRDVDATQSKLDEFERRAGKQPEAAAPAEAPAPAPAPTVQSRTIGEYPTPKLGETVEQHLNNLYNHRSAIIRKDDLIPREEQYALTRAGLPKKTNITPAEQAEFDKAGRDIARIEQKIQRGEVKRTDQARKPTKAEREEQARNTVQSFPTELHQQLMNNAQILLDRGTHPKTKKPLTREQRALAEMRIQTSRNELIRRGVIQPEPSTRTKAVLSSAQRRKLPGSSFVFPDTRSFPITDKRDIQKAVHAWGRYQGQYPFEVFKRRLTAIARRMGAVDALPDTWQVKTKAADHDMTPPQDVRDAAKRGLALRRQFGRGGTEVGIARARDLSNGASIPLATINRMVSFFARHAVDKRPDWSNPSNPSNGYIAWLLWGGDAGRRWALAMQKRMTKE